jgi:cysteine-rich repeat protein
MESFKSLDLAAAAACMLLLLTAASASAACGNGVVEAPIETCDPPGSPTPTGTLCRASCTYCGDGVTQVAAAESCDDGNTVSGCKEERHEQPLDACLNTCQRPLCGEPSRIREFDELATDKRDVVEVHVRLTSEAALDFESTPFEVEITRRLCSNDATLGCTLDAECGGGGICTDRACSHDAGVSCGTDATCSALASGSTCTATRPASLVLHSTLAGIPAGNPPRWRYRNPLAKPLGGIYLVKILGKMDQPRCAGGAGDDQRCDINLFCPDHAACVGYYTVMVKAYGDILPPTADMRTRITVGGTRWAGRGVWRPSQQGWRFDKKSARLEPTS